MQPVWAGYTCEKSKPLRGVRTIREASERSGGPLGILVRGAEDY